jgi:hypothetical protein
MAESGAAKKLGGDDDTFALSATITISQQTAIPPTEVEVKPNVGRISFVNQDQNDYRLRFWKEGTSQKESIDVLIPAGGTITIAIKTGDSFYYLILNGEAPIGGDVDIEIRPFGPIRN